MRRGWGIERAMPPDDLEGCAEAAWLVGDRYLLWAIRRVVLCGGASDLPQRSLCDRLGDGAGTEAYLALRLVLYTACMFGRRRLSLAPPGSAEVTCDEALLLQIVAAAQHGQEALLEASLLWLLAPDSPLMPIVPVRRMASLLSRGGVLLAEPVQAGSPSARFAGVCLAVQ